MKPAGNMKMRPDPASSRKVHPAKSSVRPLTFAMVTLSVARSAPAGSALNPVMLSSFGNTVSATQQINGIVGPPGPALTLTTCGVSGAPGVAVNVSVSAGAEPGG